MQPRYQLARAFKFVTRNTGDITLSTPAATWQELAAEPGGPGTGGFDLSLETQIGDVIEGGFKLVMQGAAGDVILDIRTMVAGNAVNSFVAQGPVGATAPPYGPLYLNGSSNPHVTGGILYTIQANDISSGATTFRPYAATVTAVSRVVYAGTNHLFQFYVRNLGPQDPE